MAASGPALGPICCVTITAPDLDAVAAAYTGYFDYQIAADAPLDERLAEQWQCTPLAGRRCLTLAPAAGPECVFRFIEAEAPSNFVPFQSFGWNAAEIMVQNVDGMAERLQGSPFEVVGEPADLSFSEDIRAMQLVGPGQELLYLTEFKKPLPGFDVPPARCAVDRVFIVILGGASMADMQDYYHRAFTVPRADPVESRVKGMSAAFGNSPEHRYAIAALPLRGQTLIEVDEMPPQARPREAPDGELPPGIAIVSFAGPIGANDSSLSGLSGPPYTRNGRAALRRGSAGELIEVIDSD